jgi:MFS family permease
MDIAPKYSGSASGMMNFGFGVAGIISPFALGYLIDHTGSWTLPFAVRSSSYCWARASPFACALIDRSMLLLHRHRKAAI